MPRGTETITVLARVTDEDTDWQGDPVEDAEDPDEFEDGGHPEYDLKGCITWSATNADRPDIVLAEKGVFVPASGNIPPDEHDSLLYEGAEWSINGHVGPQRKPKGKLLGWVFSMRKVT